MAIIIEKDDGKVDEPSIPERRQHPRFPFSASIEIIETKSGSRISGRTSDLGLGGCYIDSINPLPVGTLAEARIQRGQECFEVQVIVVFSQINMGMGLMFISAQPKQFRLFQRWLLEISGQLPPIQEAPEQEHEEADPHTAKDERSYVLGELLIALIRKGVLTEPEGREMLKKLLR
jgi:hypothetical protein